MGVIDKQIAPEEHTDNAVIAIPAEDKEKKKREQEDDAFFSQDDLTITNEAIRLIGLKKELGVDATSTEYDKEVKGIIDLAKEAGIKNKNQLVAELREIDYLLGQSDKPKIKKIYEYMKIRGLVRAGIRKMEALKQ